MTDRLIIDTGDLEALARSYAGAGVLVADEVESAAQRAILAVEGRAKRHVPVDTGHLRRSITSEVRPIAGGVRAVAGTNVPYAEAVEKGRRAGAAMPPQGALTAWMRRHGIEGSEFVIHRGISRRGIPPKPYLSRALAELRGDIRAEFAAVPRRVIRRLGAGR